MPGLFALGYKTFVETWKSLDPPSPFGTLLYTNPNARATYFPRFRKIFHGTVQKQLGGQHLNGKFRNENKDIYFTHRPNLAAFYVKDYDNPVLLELSSSRWAKIDFRFWERYFPAGPNQHVEIVRAWEVSPLFLHELFHYPRAEKKSWIQKALLSSAKAVEAMKTSEKPAN